VLEASEEALKKASTAPPASAAPAPAPPAPDVNYPPLEPPAR
jgi:hypothetical protein